MKTSMKIIWGIGLFLILIIAGSYLYVHTKTHVDYGNAEAEIVINGSELYAAYVKDDLSAAKKYNGKVILVSGALAAVEQLDSLKILVFHYGEGLFGKEGIRFTMLEAFDQKVHIGDEIVIKGYCTGYNDSDVIIEHASIEK
ncbi:MAG: hypothetical protein PHU27_07175 [Salinivirgaceae bacterium]|nr:hypothetical protein [Salinivirgaceae bacterium]MDD4747798.1 hypothetical protein [Salinivirgaceae bacterium]MDY0281706.1 hypothetical protein [Salinivirgaceae bacterium]